MKHWSYASENSCEDISQNPYLICKISLQFNTVTINNFEVSSNEITINRKHMNQYQHKIIKYRTNFETFG